MIRALCIMAALAAMAINVVSASEQKTGTSDAMELPPAPKDNLVGTLLEWRAWHRGLLKDAVPATIRTLRIVGPVTKPFNAQAKPLRAWSGEDFKTARLVNLRSGQNLYLGGRLCQFHFVMQLEVEAEREGSCLLALDMGPEIEVCLDRSDAPPISVLPLHQSSVKHWVSPILVDSAFLARVPVQKGLNRVLVSFGNSDPNRGPTSGNWTVSLNEGIERSLWKNACKVFPARDHPILDAMDQSWIGYRLAGQDAPVGWFRGSGMTLETEMVKTCIKDLGVEAGVEILSNALSRLESDQPGDQDPRWLRLAAAAAAYRHTVQLLTSSTSMVERLAQTYPDRYPAAAARAALADMRQQTLAKLVAAIADNSQPMIFKDVTAFQQSWLVRKHPQLQGQRILFLKREPYASFHIYDFFQDGVHGMGSDLCLLDVDTGMITSVLPEAMRDGWVDHFDLDYDAKRIVLSYRSPESPIFGIWELNLADGALKQLTAGANDPIHKTYIGHGGEGDIQPCYLPDGGIAFTSTRLLRATLCAWGLKVMTVHRMNRDGSNLYPLSSGSLGEFAPSVMSDGRLMYNRWEYVYKNVFDGHNLWSMRPDGTANESIYGNLIADPANVTFARQIPGRPDLVVAVGCGHVSFYHGSIGIVDRRRDKLSKDAWQSLTPDIQPTPGSASHVRNGRESRDILGPLFGHPWPLDADTFLVSCNLDQSAYETAAFGLCLLDTFGNRVPVHAEANSSCWNPMVFAPRPRPPALPMLTRDDPTCPGVMFMADVYNGLKDIPRGTIKYLRVLDYVPRIRPGLIPGSPMHDSMSNGAALWPAALHGVVPVDEDGSAVFEVPPKRSIFFQALDKDFKSVHTMRTFITLQPGETRSCIGCHEQRSLTPTAKATMAQQRHPLPLQDQPGDTGPRVIDYATDIQPILERHCVSCHKPGGSAAKLDLTGQADGVFSVSYRNLMNSGVISFIFEFYQPPGKPLPPKIYAESFQRNREVELQPKSWGSHASKLTEMLEQGHSKVKLSREEMIRVITWLDTNSQFYGTYLGAIRKAGDTGPVTCFLAPSHLVSPPFEAAMDPLDFMAKHPELFPTAGKR